MKKVINATTTVSVKLSKKEVKKQLLKEVEVSLVKLITESLKNKEYSIIDIPNGYVLESKNSFKYLPNKVELKQEDISDKSRRLYLTFGERVITGKVVRKLEKVIHKMESSL